MSFSSSCVKAIRRRNRRATRIMRVEARAIYRPREFRSNVKRREEVALGRADVIEFVNELREQFFKDEL